MYFIGCLRREKIQRGNGADVVHKVSADHEVRVIAVDPGCGVLRDVLLPGVDVLVYIDIHHLQFPRGNGCRKVLRALRIPARRPNPYRENRGPELERRESDIPESSLTADRIDDGTGQIRDAASTRGPGRNKKRIGKCQSFSVARRGIEPLFKV